jgi:hypothetical protein
MDEPVGPRSDLYSVGVVLYEMLTGSVPFEAEGPLATAMKHVTEPPLPPRKRNAYVPEGMDAVVMGLLAKKPEDRYESAAELVEDLRRSLAGLPPAFAGAAGYSETVRTPAVGAAPLAANTEGGEVTRACPGYLPSKPRRRKSIGAGVVALVALLAILGTLGWDLSRTPEGVSAMGAVRTTEGTREGDTLGAPEGFGGSQGGGVVRKGTDSGIPKADLSGGASVPASSASASASAPTASASSAFAAASEPSGVGARCNGARCIGAPGIESPGVRTRTPGGNLFLGPGTGRFLGLRRPRRRSRGHR